MLSPLVITSSTITTGASALPSTTFLSPWSFGFFPHIKIVNIATNLVALHGATSDEALCAFLRLLVDILKA
jgi:hypothetical protein